MMTGGKVRDTLAGAFDDRAARRFAYTPINSALAFAAAFAMLLGVASRRLGSPEFARAALERAMIWRAESREAKAIRAKEYAMAVRRAGDLEKMNANLIATKLRSTTRAKTDRGLGVIASAPPQAGREAGPAGVHPGQTQVQQNAPTKTQQPAARVLTAAERLAQKRRERR